MTIDEQIEFLYDGLKSQIAHDEPIDPQRIEELIELRRDKESAAKKWLEIRTEEMKLKTRLLTMKASAYNFKGKPDVLDKVLSLMDEFDKLAIDWVEADMCPWSLSDAAKKISEILLLIR